MAHIVAIRAPGTALTDKHSGLAICLNCMMKIYIIFLSKYTKASIYFKMKIMKISVQKFLQGKTHFKKCL